MNQAGHAVFGLEGILDEIRLARERTQLGTQRHRMPSPRCSSSKTRMSFLPAGHLRPSIRRCVSFTVRTPFADPLRTRQNFGFWRLKSPTVSFNDGKQRRNQGFCRVRSWRAVSCRIRLGHS